MKLVSTPWLKEFLRFVGETKEELLLVSPFVKLSLVRPLLLALPPRKVQLRVVTRLSAITFQQRSSDLLALELMRRGPIDTVSAELFKLNRLHAKVYIADRRHVFLGSSNLSITGFERNFEMAVQFDDPSFANRIFEILDLNKAFSMPVSAEEMEAISGTLGSLGFTTSDFSSEAEEASPASEAADDFRAAMLTEDADKSVSVGDVLGDNQEERLSLINSFLAGESLPGLNRINGESASFTLIQKEKDAAGHIPPSVQTALLAAIEKDVARLREYVLPLLPVKNAASDQLPLQLIFLDRALLELHVGQGISAIATQIDRRVSLGKIIVHTILSIHLAKQIAYGAEGAGGASVLLASIVEELDYASPLSAAGIYVYLHLGDLPQRFNQTHFYRIAGSIGAMDLARGISWARQALSDQFIYAKPVDAIIDPKTTLQSIAQALKTKASYETVRDGGTDHVPIFSSKVRIGIRNFPPVTGKSHRLAERAAASRAIDVLRGEPKTRELVLELEKVRARNIPEKPYQLPSWRTDILKNFRSRIHLHPQVPLNALDMAFTHCSKMMQRPSSRSNERLSFIGSSILQMLAAYEVVRNPKDSKLLGSILDRRMAEFANASLPDFFDEGHFEEILEWIGPSTDIPISIKKDCVQALFACAYLGSGVDGAFQLWRDRLVPLMLRRAATTTLKDEISWLQEVVQGLKKPLPTYSYVELSNPGSTSPKFKCMCQVDGIEVGVGQAATKKEARKIAARMALLRLGALPG